MFTGIIEEVGVVQSVADAGGSREIVVQAGIVLTELKNGDSISVDGVCQTVVETGHATFRVQAVGTTLSRTTLGEFQGGRHVNLERPVAAGGRFGGHFVQGHVDGVGDVIEVSREGSMQRVRLQLPDTVRPFTVLHGSIAVDGVSLTVNGLGEDGTAEVALIPYTIEHTNLSRLIPGSRVNLESDLIGKYVARALGEQAHTGASDAQVLPRLANWG